MSSTLYSCKKMNVQCRYMFPNINCFNACQAITMWCFFFTFLPRFHDKVILEEELNALRCDDNHCNQRRPIPGLWLMITGHPPRIVLKVISVTISNSSLCVWFWKCLLTTPYLNPIFDLWWIQTGAGQTLRSDHLTKQKSENSVWI